MIAELRHIIHKINECLESLSMARFSPEIQSLSMGIFSISVGMIEQCSSDLSDATVVTVGTLPLSKGFL